MIDTGLLLSAAMTYAAMWATLRWVFRGPVYKHALDTASTPAIVGVIGARVVAVLLDDPNTLRRLGDLLIIRSGVEFWAGVLAGLTALVFTARREGADPIARIVSVLPVVLVGYAAFAATCIVREGCFGPVSSVGLVPRIGGARQFPVEFVIALSVGGLGVGLSRVRWSKTTVISAAFGGLALIRLIAARWLPRIDDGWSRLDLESAFVLLGAVVLGAWSVRPLQLLPTRR